MLHEESVKNGKAVTDAEIVENFKLAKEMNCNYMRLAHYPHTERAAQIADEMGILLWEEIPVYWAIDFQNKETYRGCRKSIDRIDPTRPQRASVIVWAVGNENPIRMTANVHEHHWHIKRRAWIRLVLCPQHACLIT